MSARSASGPRATRYSDDARAGVGRALRGLIAHPEQWLTANINLPDDGGGQPPAFTTLSRANYYREVYDPQAQMIVSEPGQYAIRALDEHDDIYTFAERRRTSITLLR